MGRRLDGEIGRGVGAAGGDELRACSAGELLRRRRRGGESKVERGRGGGRLFLRRERHTHDGGRQPRTLTVALCMEQARAAAAFEERGSCGRRAAHSAALPRG